MVETSQSLQQEKPRLRSPLIVGVGASASASSSIERFFSKFSPDPGQAIVLVLQHREAFKDGSLTETFERLDGVRIFEITDGMEINGGGAKFSPPGNPDAGQNLRTAAVVGQWQAVDQMKVVFPAPFAQASPRLQLSAPRFG